jgi:hypothetical protein
MIRNSIRPIFMVRGTDGIGFSRKGEDRLIYSWKKKIMISLKFSPLRYALVIEFLNKSKQLLVLGAAIDGDRYDCINLFERERVREVFRVNGICTRVPKGNLTKGTFILFNDQFLHFSSSERTGETIIINAGRQAFCAYLNSMLTGLYLILYQDGHKLSGSVK